LPDGTLEGLGRRDQQVKVRGIRVELGGVEAALARHPAVRQAVVVAREDTPGDARLIAYVVTSDKSQVTSEDGNLLVTRYSLLVTQLRSFLKERLPSSMVPSAFVVLEAMPLTPNGKIDRRALPAPDAGRPLSAQAYVAPRDSLEVQLAEMWEAVLRVHPVGVTDNFFELGGTSLLAVRLLDQIDKRIGQSLPLTTLFEDPTIDHLAATLRERGWPGVMRMVDNLPQIKSPLVEIKPAGVKRPFFFVAPLGGVLPSNVLSGFIDVAPHLDPEQPYYGLQLPGLAHSLMPHLDLTRPLDPAHVARLMSRFGFDRRVVEDAAAECIRAVRAVQPEGPYLLGGFCTGGIITFEMAHQLHRQGQHVALTALVDTDSAILASPNGARSSAESAEIQLDAIAGVLAGLENPDLSELTWFIARDLGRNRLTKSLEEVHADLQGLGSKERWSYAVELLKPVDVIAQDTEPQEIHRMFLIYQINKLSLRYILANYTPSVYPERITFLRAEEVYNTATDPAMGWDTCSAQPVETYAIPGDHGTLFHEPHVQVFGAQIQTCLDAAQAQYGASVF
jgi:thioesterase domain-containing protein